MASLKVVSTRGNGCVNHPEFSSHCFHARQFIFTPHNNERKSRWRDYFFFFLFSRNLCRKGSQEQWEMLKPRLNRASDFYIFLWKVSGDSQVSFTSCKREPSKTCQFQSQRDSSKCKGITFENFVSQSWGIFSVSSTLKYDPGNNK